MAVFSSFSYISDFCLVIDRFVILVCHPYVKFLELLNQLNITQLFGMLSMTYSLEENDLATICPFQHPYYHVSLTSIDNHALNPSSSSLLLLI